MPPRKSDDFKKGDKVQAKWSGSNQYYSATIMEVDGKQCKVKYDDDGTVSTVKVSEVKVSSTKSESKSNRVRSRSRSGGRALRSRSRTPKKETSRKESPAANKRSPSRKASPAKKTRSSKTDKKAPKTEKKANSITPEKPAVNKKEIDVIKDETKSIKSRLPITNRSSSETVKYSEVIQETKTMSNTSSAQHRSSARIAALQTARITQTPSMERRLLRSAKSKSKYSDDEESEGDDEVDIISPMPKKFSYLSVFILSLKIIVVPMIPLLFCWACSRKNCSIMNMPPFYSKFKDFWTDIMVPLSACFAFHLALSILSKIPLGREIASSYGTRNTGRKYRLNGFYLVLLAVIIFGGLTYYKVDMNWGFDHIRGIVISSVIYTILWSFVLQLRALIRGVNPDQAKSNEQFGALGNFYYGHEINPILHFDEDVKTRFIHFGLIGLFLLNLSILTKILMKSSLKVFMDEFMAKGFPLLLNSILQLFTILDYFWREETMLSSALYNDDGVGYGFLLGIGSVIPSMFALQSVFLANHGKQIHLPYYCTLGILVIFAFGYCLYCLSSNMKHNFRSNPYSPGMSHIESIPTSKKKRLITSGLWSKIRHPNYVGFMIMVLASSLTCGFSHPLPYTPFLIIVTMLVCRSLSVEKLCQEKYGPAWNNYTQKANKRLIPFVF